MVQSINRAMDNFQHTDSRSVFGCVVTTVMGFISVNDVDHILKICTGIIAIAAGITTVWYNIVKINKEKSKK